MTMAQKVRQMDPDGRLVARARKIEELVGPHLEDIADAVFDALLRAAPNYGGPAADRATIRRNVMDFYRIQLRHLDQEEWVSRCRKLTREALGAGSHILGILLFINRAADKMRDLLLEVVTDREECYDLLSALRPIMLLHSETICATQAEMIREEDIREREKQREAFASLLTHQINGTAQIGVRLRDQAHEASTATRGMLDKASEVAAAAEQSAIAMREAAHTSSGLIRAIEDARSEVDEAAEVATLASQQAGDAVEMSTTLSDHAKSIESILGLIRDIAGQTNLLALNATIEAARAGDAGRGFAVVAQEVKSLANQTARATDDIAQKIAAIQNATRQSVETNERIRATVQDVHAMNIRIRSAMDAQSQTVTMITAAVDETALAADSMSSNISAIRQDTEIVASEIDALELGFDEVQNRLDHLRVESEGIAHAEAKAA